MQVRHACRVIEVCVGSVRGFIQFSRFRKVKRMLLHTFANQSMYRFVLITIISRPPRPATIDPYQGQPVQKADCMPLDRPRHAAVPFELVASFVNPAVVFGLRGTNLSCIFELTRCGKPWAL